MKGIQINNFFNNHISLNGKKSTSKQPNIFSQPPRPQPIVFNHNEEEPDQSSYDALTPQMKSFGKEPVSNRKKRTNTIEPVAKPRQNKKSKGKKSNSFEKFRKTVSLDKCNEKDISEDQDVSKTLSKNYKKPKISRNKNQQSQGVKRSKSAIIKNTHSKAIQPKQVSRQFLKQTKKNNIISADNSFKDVSKRQIKKETQNLLNRKEHVDKIECKTARVQSTKVKPRKNKDKIIGEINKSAEKDDKKALKFLTERKTTGISGSKSYLTSAKQSKPTSARENKKPGKKLFDSKEKDYYRIEDDVDTFRNLEDFIKDSTKDDNSQVKEALNELQSVLQGISSRKDLAKELKKLTFKLKNFPSQHNSDNDQSSQSEEEQSNSEAFKRIKDFKNNLVKKKLNEAKEGKVQQQVQSHRQQVSSSKKSSKKLLKPKKKLQDPNKHTKKPTKIQNLDSNQGQIMQSNSNQNQDTSEPEVFKNTEEEQSKYINSRNVSEFYEKEKTPKNINLQISKPNDCQQDDEDEALDATNKKYMEFLKNLQAEGQKQSEDKAFKSQQKDHEKSDDLIDDINTYLNRDYIQINKEYSSERPKDLNQSQQKSSNPLLERSKWDGYPVQNSEQDQILKNYLSQRDNESQNMNFDEIIGQVESSSNKQKRSQIEELKSFQKQSDQMMSKVGINSKFEQKKKNLTIELNQDIAKLTNIKSNEIKTPSSPKYDDRYPHMMKSPKFSDIEITNILAAKQKCLASKHQKMNELIQRMYEKELVSPKSYQYYVYQLKKQYEEEAEGFDGFKEQASQILNEINQQKNDIKAIDELIREEKWDEARKMMKENHKTAGFFGFKKNKDKAYETYETKQKPQLVKQVAVEIEISPTKRRHIAVIQNNVNITITPQTQVKSQTEVKKSEQQKPKDKNISKGGLIRQQQRKISSSSSEEEHEENEESITKQLDFDFEQKYRLKSNEDEFSSRNKISVQDKFDSELDSYLNAQKADSQDFEHYVYYQSESNEQTLKSEPSKEEKAEESSARLKPEGIFKLFEVIQGENDDEEEQKNDSDSDASQKYQRVIVSKSDEDNVMKIDQQEPKQSCSHELEQLISQPKSLTQDKKHKCGDDQDDDSDNGSILQLELRKGFESNLFFIKEYCISLCEYIRDNSELKNQFRQDISQPMQFETQRLLKKYRKALDGIYTDQYNSTVAQLEYKTEFRKAPNKAIPSELANQFNKSYGPLKFWNRDLSKKGREKFKMEKEAEKIFLSAILEVLNESLDFQRPGSIFGKPLQWANKSKHLKNMKYLHGQKTKKVTPDTQQAAQTYDFIFGVAIARIIQWGSCLCGFLPDTAELENTQIDDDYVVHIRETRMAFLLEKMLAEEEVTFNNSELEETEIMLWLGKTISEELINQAAGEITSLKFSLGLDFIQDDNNY